MSLPVHHDCVRDDRPLRDRDEPPGQEQIDCPLLWIYEVWTVYSALSAANSVKMQYQI